MWWNIGVWVLTVGAFALAAVLSHPKIRNSSNDLRTPVMLMVEGVAAMGVSLGFALRSGSLKHWTDAHLCLRFGLWSAAIFRLLPPIMNEDVLFLKGGLTFDAPYVVLGVCIHGGLTAMIASPLAMRVVDHPLWESDRDVLQLSGSAILFFYVIACAVRLFTENW